MRNSIIPSLAARLATAKKLREWCRFGLLTAGPSKELRAAPKNVNSRRKENMTQTSTIMQHHTIIDTFFEDIGFPALPRDHSLHRQWRSQLDAVRRTEKSQKTRKRHRPTSSGRNCK